MLRDPYYTQTPGYFWDPVMCRGLRRGLAE